MTHYVKMYAYEKACTEVVQHVIKGEKIFASFLWFANSFIATTQPQYSNFKFFGLTVASKQTKFLPNHWKSSIQQEIETRRQSMEVGNYDKEKDKMEGLFGFFVVATILIGVYGMKLWGLRKHRRLVDGKFFAITLSFIFVKEENNNWFWHNYF